MNAERLRELAEFLLAEEARLTLQSAIEELRDALQQLGGSPGDQTLQNQVSSARTRVATSTALIAENLTPARRNAVAEIGGTPFFSDAILSCVNEAISDNAMTPHVASTEMGRLVDERRQFMERLQQLRDGLASFGVGLPPSTPGEAEISFLLPQGLSDGNFEQFAKELQNITFVINTFTELVNGKPQPARLLQLSSTGPIVVVGVAVSAVPALGKTVTWLLDTWKSALSLKALHDKGRDLKLDDRLLKGIEDSIKTMIESAVEQQTERLIQTYRSSPDKYRGRVSELRLALSQAQRQLIVRLEQGMQIEVRYLPEALPEGTAEEQQQTDETFVREVQELAKQLSFPGPSAEPLLQSALEQTAARTPATA